MISMNLNNLIQILNENPKSVEFEDCINVIDQHYDFATSAFSNGNLQNEAGQNNGSCKILAFGLIHQLTELQTLACFGKYYREDVLEHPDAVDHQNIRQFMLSGWSGVSFSNQALTTR